MAVDCSQKHRVSGTVIMVADRHRRLVAEFFESGSSSSDCFLSSPKSFRAAFLLLFAFNIAISSSATTFKCHVISNCSPTSLSQRTYAAHFDE
jgi:hypothetical protein